MFKAAGRFGNPGIVITSPVKATMKPAPVLGYQFANGNVKTRRRPEETWII